MPVATKYLYVPNELAATATNLLTSAIIPGGTDPNYLSGLAKAGTLKLVAVPAVYLGGDINNWYIGADKSEVEVARLGFMDGREDPEVFYQDAPLDGAVFTRDAYTYKARHEYGGVITDWRGLTWLSSCIH